MVRTVQCVKLGRELPSMARPPFPGELGQRIYDNVSQQAWNLWPAQATIVINHYGLSMADPSAQQILMQQMEEFFFGADARMPEGWSAQGQSTKGGAPQPQRKK